MFGRLVYDYLFFGIPTILMLLFVISLCRYVSARKKSKKAPGTITPADLKVRKIFLIITSVFVGMLLVIVIGVMILLSGAVVHM